MLQIENNTSQELTVSSIDDNAFKVHPTALVGGTLYNIAQGQKIPSHSTIIVTGNSSWNSSGDISQHIKLIGPESGMVDLEVSFSSFFAGFGNCTASINTMSETFGMRTVYANGTPATATVSIN